MAIEPTKRYLVSIHQHFLTPNDSPPAPSSRTSTCLLIVSDKNQYLRDFSGQPLTWRTQSLPSNRQIGMHPGLPSQQQFSWGYSMRCIAVLQTPCLSQTRLAARSAKPLVTGQQGAEVVRCRIPLCSIKVFGCFVVQENQLRLNPFGDYHQECCISLKRIYLNSRPGPRSLATPKGVGTLVISRATSLVIPGWQSSIPEYTSDFPLLVLLLPSDP